MLQSVRQQNNLCWSKLFVFHVYYLSTRKQLNEK